MLIANAMNTNSLALNRFRADVLAHAGEIETALALGAEARNSVSPYVQASFEASLIPAIDSLRSLGIVWIPGLMAGMLLSGARPVYAAIYQFVVLAMIFAASGLTSLISTMLIRGRVFSPRNNCCCNREGNRGILMDHVTIAIVSHAKAAERHAAGPRCAPWRHWNWPREWSCFCWALARCRWSTRTPGTPRKPCCDFCM